VTFINKLKAAWDKNNSLLCVGLDPDMAKLPQHIRELSCPLFEFNKAIIDATGDLVCAYKPQIAFYAAHGAENELEDTIDYIRRKYPGIAVILDSKRGDMDNTSRMYAVEAFDRYKADAVTVNPYFGLDSMAPFLDRADRGVIILCRTTNAGAGEIQDLMVGSDPQTGSASPCEHRKLYQVIAERAATVWNYNKNVALVVGATYPEQLADVRAITGDMPFLIPGIGAQGADVEATVKNGADSAGAGMIINVSRSVIYAGAENDFSQAAAAEARRLRDEINKYRKLSVTAKQV
jgi:orotidine-5'-phosphate decarboxylase